jgi:hypothetical protein
MFLVVWKFETGVDCWSQPIDFATAALIQSHFALQEVQSEIVVATRSFRDKIASTPNVRSQMTNSLMLAVKCAKMSFLPHPLPVIQGLFEFEDAANRRVGKLVIPSGS